MIIITIVLLCHYYQLSIFPFVLIVLFLSDFTIIHYCTCKVVACDVSVTQLWNTLP